MKNEQKALIEKYERLRIEERQNPRSDKYYDESSRIVDEYQDRFIAPFLRKATRQEYADWLHGWLGKGNGVEPVDRNFEDDEYYVAVADFIMLPLHGARARDIIIPEDVTVDLSHGVGHCDIFKMRNFEAIDVYKVYMYKNMGVANKCACSCGHTPNVKVSIEVDGNVKEAWSLKNLFK